MTKLLVATSNPGKVAELAALLKDLPCQVIGLSDLPQPLPIAAETGATFSENALMKAEDYPFSSAKPTIELDPAPKHLQG